MLLMCGVTGAAEDSQSSQHLQVNGGVPALKKRTGATGNNSLVRSSNRPGRVVPPDMSFVPFLCLCESTAAGPFVKTTFWMCCMLRVTNGFLPLLSPSTLHTA